MYEFLCVSGVFSDRNSILAKSLVIQGHRALTCTSGGSESGFRAWMPQLCHRGVRAACRLCLGLWLSVAVCPLRVKARRTQASRKLKGVDDEDAAMGTVALVSDVGVFSCSVNIQSTSADSSLAPPSPRPCGQLGRQLRGDFLWVLPLPLSEPMVSPLPGPC